MKRSVKVQTSAHWVTALLNSKELHNIHAPFFGSIVKRSVLVFIPTRWIAALFIGQILDYVQVTKLSSIVKRSFSILTCNI